MKDTNYKVAEQTAKTRNRAVKVLIYTLLTIWALWVLFPFYWMVLTSFKSYSAYASETIPQLFTLSPTLESYATAFTGVPLAGYFLNTLIFTLAIILLLAVLAVIGYYSFIRKGGRKNG